jgi:HEAT repeat protein
MRKIHAILKLSAMTAGVAMMVAACSKSEENPPPEPPVTPARSEPSKPAPSAAKPSETSAPKSTAVAPTAPAPASDAAQVAATLENAYISNPDFNSRVEQIYKLTDAGTPEAIASLGRLFHMEKDNDLKVEILDSLFDIDGQDERKAALLSAGAGADQPKEVRESAIDGLEDIEPKYALPILQALLGDPDEDIRDAAKDAIETLQSQQATPSQAAPAQPK